MADLRVSSNWTVFSTLRKLLTVAPDSAHQFVQLFHDADRLVHAAQQFVDVLALKLPAFGVLPRLFGLLPLGGQLPGDGHQLGTVAAHEPGPLLVCACSAGWGAAAAPGGATSA